MLSLPPMLLSCSLAMWAAQPPASSTFAPKINAIYQDKLAPLPKPKEAVLLKGNKRFKVELTGLQPKDTVVLHVNGSVIDTYTCGEAKDLKKAIPERSGIYSLEIDPAGWKPATYQVQCLVIRDGVGSAKTDAVDVNLEAAKEAKEKKEARRPDPPQAPTVIPSYSFDTTPLVKSIRAATDEDCGNGRRPCKPGDADEEAPQATTAKERLPVADYVFSGPAHFPMPAFGALGERKKLDALIVYEGMRFAAYEDGHFEISLAATTSDVPVTLRLVLHLDLPGGTPFQITLPPIAIDSASSVSGNYSSGSAVGNYRGRTIHVRHCGFSRELRECLKFAPRGPEPCRWPEGYVCRDGMARFGTLPLSGN
jgi:hypothetical protein